MIKEMPLLDADPELWLSSLADDELDWRQRESLCLWLEQHPAWWRNCAIALMDQQAMLRGVRDVTALDRHGRSATTASDVRVGTVKPVVDAGPAAPGSRHRSALTSALAVALLAVVAACSVLWWQAVAGRAALGNELQRSRETCQRLTADLARRMAVNPGLTLAQLYPDHRVLVEIDDSPNRTVYLTDQPVSDLLLESFVAAGHDVDVQPYEPRYQTQSMRQLRNPVLAVEVRKSGLILTSLEDLQ